MRRFANIKSSSLLFGKGQKRELYAVIILIILGLSLTLWVRQDRAQLKEFCSENLAKEQQLVIEKSWSKANFAAKEESLKCAKVISRAQQLIVYHDLAVSSYFTNDKEKAREYAEDGLALNAKLTNKERDGLKNQADIAFTLADIKTGAYQVTETIKIMDESGKIIER